ncbi:MAG: division/cell wall cluster transcriptional repressor MraZ [Sphingomonas bacterium]|nr:division/cell wall cluster transcriptional repressor MraZ [Sphingomonas bacterium]
MSERGDYQGSGLALVDDKGRVAIPNALRGTLADNSPRADGKKDGGIVIIAAHEDAPCLIAYDPAYVAELKRELNERVALSRGENGKVDHNIKRAGANGEAVPFDGSGRFIMPGFPRFYAGIGSNAFFWGTLDYIEIWDPRTLVATPGLSPQMVAACRYYCQEKGIEL